MESWKEVEFNCMADCKAPICPIADFTSDTKWMEGWINLMGLADIELLSFWSTFICQHVRNGKPLIYMFNHIFKLW